MARIDALLACGSLLLLPVERFDAACVILERLYPGDFRDCAYPLRENAARERPETDPAHKRAVQELVAGDMPLYRRALRFLEETRRALFPDEAAFEDALRRFARRNARRAAADRARRLLERHLNGALA